MWILGMLVDDCSTRLVMMAPGLRIVTVKMEKGA